MSRFVSRISAALILTATILSFAIINVDDSFRLHMLGLGFLFGFFMLLWSFREK
jgi:hypothetical protein